MAALRGFRTPKGSSHAFRFRIRSFMPEYSAPAEPPVESIRRWLESPSLTCHREEPSDEAISQ